MRVALVLLLSAFALAVAKAQVPMDVKPAALGDAAHVFEVVNGEAVITLDPIKRVDLSATEAMFTVRNGTSAALTPRFSAEFFNRYGMLVTSVRVSFESDPVPAGAVRAITRSLTFPALDAVFSASTIRLPSDWKTIRFVRIQSQPGAVTSVPDLKTQPQADALRARPRPPIKKPTPVRPAILDRNKFGTSNIALNAWDARWCNYGAYLQRMIDTIQIQWERGLVQSRVYPPAGGTVTVKFILDSEGRIARIVDVKNQSTESAAAACVSGITDRAPYGPWTEDMKAVLGKQQELTFTFKYQ